MYAGVPSAEAADELDCFASAAEDDCALCLVVIWMRAHVIHLHPLQSLVPDLDCFAKRPCADEFAIFVIPIVSGKQAATLFYALVRLDQHELRQPALATPIRAHQECACLGVDCIPLTKEALDWIGDDLLNQLTVISSDSTNAGATVVSDISKSRTGLSLTTNQEPGASKTVVFGWTIMRES
jgi:hypothetical protein